MKKNNSPIEICSLLKRVKYLLSITLLLCMISLFSFKELYAKEECDSIYEHVQNISLEVKKHELPLSTILTRIGCEPKLYSFGMPHGGLTYIVLYFTLNDTSDMVATFYLKTFYKKDIPIFADALNLDMMGSEFISSIRYEITPPQSPEWVQQHQDIKLLSTLFVQQPEVFEALQRLCTNFPLCMIGNKKKAPTPAATPGGD